MIAIRLLLLAVILGGVVSCERVDTNDENDDTGTTLFFTENDDLTFEQGTATDTISDTASETDTGSQTDSLEVSCNGKADDNSDAAITVTLPLGGDTWHAGTSEEIAWAADEEIGKVDILVSMDGGETYSVYVSGSINDGQEEVWLSDNHKTVENIYIKICDTSDPLKCDEMDAPFTIHALSDDTYAPNQTIDNATPVFEGNTITATLTGDATQDVFMFDGAADDHVVVQRHRVDAPFVVMNLQIALLDTTGNILAEMSSGFNDASALDATLPASGQYFLIVSSPYADTGDYSFTLTIQD